MAALTLKDPDWRNGNPILLKYSFAQLNDGGYLNIKKGQIEDIRPCESAAKARASSGDYSTFAEETTAKAPSPPNGDVIHPVFRQDRWKLADATDYQYLLPAVKLASCLLDEPCVLPFFAGLKRSRRELHNPEAERLFKQKLYHFTPYADQNSDDYAAVRIETWRWLAELAEYVTWEFDSYDNIYARTLRSHVVSEKSGGLQKYASRIIVNDMYLEAVKGVQQQPVAPHSERMDRQSMLLRTHFHLAICLIHELTHAVHNAIIPRTYDELNKQIPRAAETFFQNDRYTETGWALTQFVLGGIPAPNGPPLDLRFHYGTHMIDFPGAMDRTEMKFNTLFQFQTPFQARQAQKWWYAVEMSYMKKFFTKEFWERDLRNDPNATLRYQKTDFRASTIVW